MLNPLRSRSLQYTCAAALLFLAPAVLAAQERIREPLPLEVAVSLHSHNPRATIGLSPNGEWVAHTVLTDETVATATGSYYHSGTGTPLADGDGRMEAMLTHTRTGETIRLGGAASSSWGAVWSPDGRRVAFYSDEGGEAGVWVWERATRKATRFTGVIARPQFGFEVPRWSSDGERILVKILPAAMTVTQANARGPLQLNTGLRFPGAGPGEPSVIVKRAGPAEAVPVKVEAPVTEARPVGDVNGAVADLAILDLRTRTVTRLAEGVAARWYAFSPDERQVAYTVLRGWQLNSQQPLYDVMVVDAAGGRPRRLAESARLGYGTEWSWSPDGKIIAYTESGQLVEQGIVLLPVEGGTPRNLKPQGAPSFGKGEFGELVDAPVWDASGRHLYAVGGGELWRIEARSGEGKALARIPGWEIRAVVQPFGKPVLATAERGQTAWVVATDGDGRRSGLFAVDLASGKVRKGLDEDKAYTTLYNLSVSEATGEIAFVSADQQHLREVWLFNPRNGKARQATHINPELERYELGTSRLIEWTGPEGKMLKGALLLPPGYREGQRLPTVVWGYGGAMGSEDVNRFGFWGESPTFNMHVLATRGYAILAPDIPVRTGRTMRDIYEAVNSAADAVVAQGYADPERLAIMGQSYGSFTTLSVITQTPRFKAAVITAAMLHPDLFADYLNGGQSSIGYYEHGQGNMGGSIWEQHDRYRDNSPLFLFDRVRTPLLIGQGEKDGLNLTPSEAIFTALERLGQIVEYRLYEDEGHVLYQKANVLDFWKRRLEFLAEHLKLRPDVGGKVAAFRTGVLTPLVETPPDKRSSVK